MEIIMAKSAKVYRSARGTTIDMESLRVANGDMKALGNVSMNARGDVLDTKGNVVKRRTQIVQDYYKNNPDGVKQVSLKPANNEYMTPAEALAKMAADSIPDSPQGLLGRKARKLVNPKE